MDSRPTDDGAVGADDQGGASTRVNTSWPGAPPNKHRTPLSPPSSTNVCITPRESILSVWKGADAIFVCRGAVNAQIPTYATAIPIQSPSHRHAGTCAQVREGSKRRRQGNREGMALLTPWHVSGARSQHTATQAISPSPSTRGTSNTAREPTHTRRRRASSTTAASH